MKGSPLKRNVRTSRAALRLRSAHGSALSDRIRSEKGGGDWRVAGYRGTRQGDVHHHMPQTEPVPHNRTTVYVRRATAACSRGTRIVISTQCILQHAVHGYGISRRKRTWIARRHRIRRSCWTSCGSAGGSRAARRWLRSRIGRCSTRRPRRWCRTRTRRASA